VVCSRTTTMARDGTSPGGAAESAGEPIRVGLVSGFLGAGKTTAMRSIGEELTGRGYTVGMITNDQASGLVDTAVLDETAGTVVEIPDGCFCCNFTRLLEAARSIDQRDVDVLLAEPVGSCTDLVATVVNPLRSIHAEEFSVAPLTAVLDPDRVRSYLDDGSGDLPEEVRYIFRMQVEEADLIALNKTDTLTDAETERLVGELEDRVGDRPVVPVSAERGTGIEAWLSALFPEVETGETLDVAGELTAEGRALADIDYDTYAEGEARLGWVNMTVDLDGPFDPARFRVELMERIRRSLRRNDIEVAHLKFSLSADGKLCRANLTSTDSEPAYGGAEPGTVAESQLVFNARAVGDPEEIRTIAGDAVGATADRMSANATVEEERAFRPEYPEPVHRMEGGDDGTGPGPSGG